MHWRRWSRRCAYDGPWRAAVCAALALDRSSTPARRMVAAATTGLPERLAGAQLRLPLLLGARHELRPGRLAAPGAGPARAGDVAGGCCGRAGARTRASPCSSRSTTSRSCPSATSTCPGTGARCRCAWATTPGRSSSSGRSPTCIETAWLFAESGSELGEEAGARLGGVADRVCTVWRHPDSGIWELDDHRHYTGSRVAAWTALERALRLHEAGQIADGDPSAGARR